MKTFKEKRLLNNFVPGKLVDTNKLWWMRDVEM